MLRYYDTLVASDKIRLDEKTPFHYTILTYGMVSSQAQEHNLSFQFHRILFKDLVDTLEKKVRIKIYYTNKWVDSLYLNINSENDSLEGLLSKALIKEWLFIYHYRT